DAVREERCERLAGQGPERDDEGSGHNGDENPAGHIAAVRAGLAAASGAGWRGFRAGTREGRQQRRERREEQRVQAGEHGFCFGMRERIVRGQGPSCRTARVGYRAKTTVTGSTKRTTGTSMPTSFLPLTSMRARRPCSRTSAAWARRTSARGVPREVATAMPSTNR